MALVLGACSPVFSACDAAQAGAFADKSVTGIGKGIAEVDSQIHGKQGHYTKQLTVVGCIDLQPENVAPCVRKVMGCEPGSNGEQCAAVVVKSWAPTKLVMTTINELWCAMIPTAENCEVP